jgi:hypothetical protein
VLYWGTLSLLYLLNIMKYISLVFLRKKSKGVLVLANLCHVLFSGKWMLISTLLLVSCT